MNRQRAEDVHKHAEFEVRFWEGELNSAFCFKIQLSPMVTLNVTVFFKMKISMKAFQLFLKALVNVRQGTYYLIYNMKRPL